MIRDARAWAAAVCVVGLGLALPGAARAEEREAVIASLRFEGVEVLPVARLEERMRTGAPPPFWKPWAPDPVFAEEDLREDLDRIVSLYRDAGYYQAKAEYELEWRRGGRAVRIAIRVREGEPVRVVAREVELPPGEWLGPEEREVLRADLPLAPGEVFGAASYREAREALLRRLAERGHPAAALEGGAEVDLVRREARVAWRVVPGPRVHFGEVRVQGLARVDEELVLRELTFAPGEVYSPAALEASQRSVFDVGLFHSVSIQPARAAATTAPAPPAAGPGDEAPWPIAVRVHERPPRTVRIGVGYGTEDEFRGRVSWLHRNFLGQARSLELAAKASSLVLGVEARFAQPRFWRPELRLDADASAVRETVPAFDANRVATGVLLRRPLVGDWVGRIGHRLELADVTDVSAAEPGAEEDSRLSTLRLGVERQAVDDLRYPRRGTRLDLEVAPTLRAFGSDRSFSTFRLEGRAFAPVPATPAVLALRLKLGAIQPGPDSDRSEVPIFKRFFSGGSGSVRGFGFQQLGPLDAGGDPLGGLTQAEGSLELRFPIWRFLSGVAFVDAGQVNRSAWRLDADDFGVGAGPGLRVDTPIGPVGLDWGYVLRGRQGRDRGRLHFSLGVAF